MTNYYMVLNSSIIFFTSRVPLYIRMSLCADAEFYCYICLKL
jgi:hypothetical protein